MLLRLVQTGKDKMKYNTKQQRLVAITDTYCKIFNITMFTSKEIADWAISMGLWPVPRRNDPAEICDEWEQRLEKTANQLPDTWIG